MASRSFLTSDNCIISVCIFPEVKCWYLSFVRNIDVSIVDPSGFHTCFKDFCQFLWCAYVPCPKGSGNGGQEPLLSVYAETFLKFFFYKNSYFILYSNYYMMMIKRFKMIRLSVLGRNFSAVITISLREAPTCCFLSISAWQHQYSSIFVLFGTSSGFQIFLLPRKKFKRGRYSFPGKICWVC